MSVSERVMTAISSGDLDGLRRILEEDRGAARARNEAGVSAVLMARYHGRQEMVDLLLEFEPELDLFDAAALGDVPRVRELLEADPSLTGRYAGDGFTALHLAAFCGQLAVMELLIDRGADVCAVTTNDMRVQPIHSAAAAQSNEAVDLLLRHGADPDAQQHGGWTALQAAAQHGDEQMVSTLLSHGADPQVRSDDGRTAMDLAQEQGHAQVLMLIAGGSL